MSGRYDAIAVRTYQDRDGNEKSIFTNIGVAWPMKEKDGYRVVLHAMPAPDKGEFTILLMPPKPREEGRRSAMDEAAGRGFAPDRSGRGGSLADDLDDEIPF